MAVDAGVALHVAVALLDDNRILLVRQNYRDRLWSLPGGGVEARESSVEAAIREVAEESGYLVAIDHLVGVYDAPARGMLSLCYRGAVRGRSAWSPGEEIVEVGWFPVSHLPQPMSRRMVQRVRDAADGQRGIVRVDGGA